ncbi:MAG: hypothetical protein JNK42_03460 [Caedimonas sp.]|jgi:hypothetical protein|nr:hypothetical protein [Caedimonas sp.]
MTLRKEKIRLVFFLTGFVGFSSNAMPQKADFSLFFTEQELQAFALTKDPSPRLGREENSLYLGALFYQSPQEWSVWVNDHKMTSTHPRSSLSHLSVCVRVVSPHSATLEWAYEGEQHHVTLKPNQSYHPMSREIREGQ